MTHLNPNAPLPPPGTGPPLGWPEAVVTIVVVAAVVVLILAGELPASALTLALPIPISRK